MAFLSFKKNRSATQQEQSWRWGGGEQSPPRDSATAAKAHARTPEHYDEDDEDELYDDRKKGIRINVWRLATAMLFLMFIGALSSLCYLMWTPREIQVAGHGDQGVAHDLRVLAQQNQGVQITLTEGEVNRFLRDTCRLRQRGVFSITAHPKAVLLRIHDGYGELIIKRSIGTSFHHTTSVLVHFVRKEHEGESRVEMEFTGGKPIFGKIPCGGYIGSMPVPQSFIQMMQPSLESLLTTYPDFAQLVHEQGYLPVFSKEKNTAEGRLLLLPPSNNI